MEKSVNSKHRHYVAAATLWSERPLPVQLYFVLDRVKALAPQRPE